MRHWIGLAAVLPGLAPFALAQRFGFTHQMLPPDTDGTTTVALGDVDGDGDVDALFGNGGACFFCVGAQNRLYLGDGTGTFADVTSTSLPVLLDNTQAVALGDVDADGDLDAYIGNFGQDGLLLNGGAGIFTAAAATNLPALLDSRTAVALGDVDGDGDLDALLANFGGERLYRNGGTGVFTDVTATSLPAVTDSPTALAVGDVDGDGDLDALVGNYGVQDRVLRNGGTGTFTDDTATSFPASSDPTRAVALGDVDGDGDLDAFFGNAIPTPAVQDRLYLNGGTGIFADVTATNLPALLGNTQAVALGDVDGDGDLDAFKGSQVQDRLYRNGGTGTFTDDTAMDFPSPIDNTPAVALGDADGDGDLDAFAGNLWQDHLHLNDGAGVFTDVTATNLLPLLDNTQAVALGDVDGDGDLDAFVGASGGCPGCSGAQSRLYLNNGVGVLGEVTATNLPALFDNTQAAALGDVDGDGDLDAFLGNWGQERLHRNDGTGGFTDVTSMSLPAVPDDTFAVAFGDVDGDGDLDAFVGNGNGQQDRLYRNGGPGVFTNVTTSNLPALLGNTQAVALGDLDGDGDPDAFIGDGGPAAQNRLYLNGGTGAFADATASNLPPLLGNAQAVALGDVDGDGDLDAFIGNGAPAAQNRLFLNGGVGAFADATATNLPALVDNTQSVALGDVDGDGDLDAVVGEFGGERLYLNGGTGVFSDATAPNLPATNDPTTAVALGDLDGDADLDAVVGNAGQPNRVHTNLARQVAWRGIPRAGKPLVLDLWGPANGPWVLGVALGSASIPVPPVGTIRLDPATLFVVGGGVLDPQGRASITFLVPSSPASVGLSVYWQAGVGTPVLLTNLEITTVTNL